MLVAAAVVSSAERMGPQYRVVHMHRKEPPSVLDMLNSIDVGNAIANMVLQGRALIGLILFFSHFAYQHRKQD